MLSPPLMRLVTSNTLLITLLNKRSLRKHSDNILSDIGLLNSNILCLKETQLNLDEDASTTTLKFQGNFTMYFNCNRDKAYSSIMLLCNSKDCDSMSVFTFKEP